MRCSKHRSQRKVHSDPDLPQKKKKEKQEKSQIKSLTYHLKELEKDKKKRNLKTAEGVIEIREEVNKTDIF